MPAICNWRFAPSAIRFTPASRSWWIPPDGWKNSCVATAANNRFAVGGRGHCRVNSSADFEGITDIRLGRVRPFPKRKAALFGALILLWLTPGIVGRDPWKPGEPTLAAVIKNLVEDGFSLAPNFVGSPFAEHPPLYLWLAAASAHLFSPILELHEGARIGSAILLLAGLAALGFACGRWHGGRAGWLAAILAVGFTGLLVRGHLLAIGVAEFFGISIALLGFSLLKKNPAMHADGNFSSGGIYSDSFHFDEHFFDDGDFLHDGGVFAGKKSRRKKINSSPPRESANDNFSGDSLWGGAIAGCGIGIMFMCGGFLAAMPGVFLFLPPIFSSQWRSPSIFAGLAAAVVFAAPWFLLWPLALARAAPEIFDLWLAEELAEFSQFNFAAMIQLIKTAAWSLWPSWAIALGGFYYLRREKKRRRIASANPDIALAIAAFGGACLAFLLGGGGNEIALFSAMPPLAMLAAAGLSRLPETRAGILDWFAIFCVGVFFVGGQWLAWLATQWNWPPSFAGWILSLRPGVDIEVGGIAIASAIALTVGWCALAAKFNYSNERAVVNWTAAMTLAWLLFCLLWMNYVDAGKSYRRLAADLRVVTAGECVAMRGLSKNNIAQFYYFAGIAPAADGDNCRWLLTRGESPISSNELKWRSGRFAGDDEIFSLYEIRAFDSGAEKK